MNLKPNVLRMDFRGEIKDRQVFLREIKEKLMELFDDLMPFVSLIVEIAKNIFDHAQGVGSLVIEFKDDSFKFVIKDGGQIAYDFEYCRRNSRLAGNKVNFGIGLKSILDLAQGLGIDLYIDTTKGFSYSGIYIYPKKMS